MSRRLRSLLSVLLLALAAALPLGVRAQEGPVQVHYLVVYASNDARRFDARLKPLEDSLRVLQFSGFDVLSDGQFPLRPGQARLVDLAGPETLEVTLADVDKERAKLRVRRMVRGKPTSTTNLTIRRGGTFLYGGVRHKGGRLVVPIRVRY